MVAFARLRKFMFLHSFSDNTPIFDICSMPATPKKRMETQACVFNTAIMAVAARPWLDIELKYDDDRLLEERKVVSSRL